MGVHVARYESEGKVTWGVVDEGVLLPIPGDYTSLGDFLTHGKELAVSMNLQDRNAAVSLDSVRILGPVTAPCSVVCQGLNYGTHRAESGTSEEKAPFNLLFMKADSSLSGPYDDVIRPRGVKLLDYELELGLVIGKAVTGNTTITESNIADYVAGVVISNDVSARDIQIPQAQWFKGKSYRTFCPTGPYLYLFDGDDIRKLKDIEIRLEVNGKMRQEANTSQLLYGPAETISELSGLMDLRPGDLIQTGTPGGVAVKAPPARVQRIARFLLGEKKLMHVFVKKQLENPNYLKDGDVMRLTMRSSDGSIDLGVMETRIVAEE